MATVTTSSSGSIGGSRERIAREPTTLELVFDRTLKGTAITFAFLTIVLVFFLVGQVAYDSREAIQEDGLSLVTSTTWNPNAGEYGLLPALVGTVISSVLALAIGGAFGVAIAVFLTQDFLPRTFNLLLKNTVDLLAAIPSVVYGLWGLVVVMPLLQPIATWLNQTLGQIPYLGALFGPLNIGGLAPASLVLAIMVLPTISAISRDALAAVHPRIKEAAYGLGATRWEVILGVMLPTAATGIFGGMILGLGRALGETMALAMLMGNTNRLSWSIFAEGNTLAALIANTFKEADAEMYPRLFFAALLLLSITMIVNVFGTLILQRASARFRGAR